MIFGEQFSAFHTALAFVFGMRFMVFGEGRLAHKGLPSLHTRIGPLSLVDPLMDNEV